MTGPTASLAAVTSLTSGLAQTPLSRPVRPLFCSLRAPCALGRYPFASCEVFCCEVDPIFTTLLEDEDLMKSLFSIIQADGSLNCTLVGYFGRVVTHLMIRKSAQMFKYFETHPEVLDALVSHMDNASIAEIVLRVVGADEQTNLIVPATHLQWLAETHLVEQLISRLSVKHKPDLRKNAAQVLGAVIRSSASPIARKLTLPESLDALLDSVFCEPRSISVPALTVCIALIDPQRRMPENEYPVPAMEDDRAPNVTALEKISNVVKRLVDFLDDPEPISTQETPYGYLDPPVGFLRLKVIELLAVLMNSGFEPALQAVVDAGAFPRCLDLFLRYPFNNVLHRNVVALVSAAFDCGKPFVLDHIFLDSRIAEWLVSVPEMASVLRRPAASSEADDVEKQLDEPSSDCNEGEQKEDVAEANASLPLAQPLKAGYIGHITMMANHVVVVSKKAENIRNLLTLNAGWQRYQSETLDLRNDREDVTKWGCGRPSSGPHQGPGSDGDDQVRNPQPSPHVFFPALDFQGSAPPPICILHLSSLKFLSDCRSLSCCWWCKALQKHSRCSIKENILQSGIS